MNLAQIKVEYLISFSDALFAFSITLMALSIELPNLHNNILEPQLTKLIGQELIPNIIHYVISFLVVGLYWIGYHRIFEYIKRTNLTLIWLNLVFLLFISLVAYFTGLLSTYGTYRIVVISFASILATTGFISVLMWWYATNNRRLVYENLDSDLVRYYLIRGLVPSFNWSFIYWCSIGPVLLDNDVSCKFYSKQNTSTSAFLIVIHSELWAANFLSNLA